MGNVGFFTIFLVIIANFCFFSGQVDSQARLLKPVTRQSAFRFPEYAAFNPPQNTEDHRLNCGNIAQSTIVGGNCGVCGDPFTKPVPRDYEMGGVNYRGFFTGNYSAEQIIETEVDIIVNKGGYMEFRLCDTPLSAETQECFNEHVLQRADGLGSTVSISKTGSHVTLLKLPANVSCEHCVMQWNYRVANNWGDCGDGTGAVGCGPQETFRGCSDVIIN